MDHIGDPPANAGASQTILIVDDDVQVLKCVARILASLNCTHVLQAGTIQQAFELWSRHRDTIGLVISDFVMPEQTGDQMVSRMLQDNARVKVLFISGNDPATIDSLIPLEAGINFLQKPFTVAEMKKTVSGLTSLPLASCQS